MMQRGPRAAPGERDNELLRNTTRRIVWQLTAAITVVVLAMSATALIVGEHQEHVQADAAAHRAWASARPGDLSTPTAASAWLVVQSRDGTRTATAEAPAKIAALRPAELPDGASERRVDGTELVIWTGDREFGRVGAVYDMTMRERELPGLVLTLVLASLVGVIGAVLVGVGIGRRAARPLAQAMAIQDRFVANASHELRTPLAVLRLRAELLQRRDRVKLGNSFDADLARLVQDAQAAGEVVNDLLLAAELEFRPQLGDPVNLRRLATELVDQVQPLAQKRSIALSVAAPGLDDETRLPAPDPFARGRHGVLLRALSALVDNALSHTPDHGHVRIETGRCGNIATISVVDDGVGVTPGQVKRIFEPFARASERTGSRNFGLGLALVGDIARAHGGHITVDSDPGNGATFTMVLPAIDEP